MNTDQNPELTADTNGIEPVAEVLPELWALRLPGGDIVTAICGHLQTFDSQKEAVEYAEGQPELDYAVAVLFVPVSR